MPFIHPMLFAGGAAAASVPIIIHLLNRRRFKVLDWAAMKFLLESVRKNRRRVRIEELILLALRCLAIFLLAVAVGRFMGCAPTSVVPVSAPAQTAHIFILDDSVSMGQKVGDTTAMAKAAGDLSDMLGEVSATDRVAVLLTSRSEAVFPLDSMADPETLVGKLKSFKPSDTTTQLHHSIKTALEMFEEVKTQKRLYILSDFRQSDYSPGSMLDEVQREFKNLSEADAELVLMNYGAYTSETENLTVVDVQILNKLAVASVPIKMRLRVRNNGTKRAENVTVKFAVQSSDRTLPVRTIRSIDPGQTESVQIAYTFSGAGSAVIEAQLPADNLAGDNTAYLALNVRDARKVLIIDGEPNFIKPVNSESFLLAFAMDPTGNGRHGNKPDRISVDHLADVNFEVYDVVILANVSEFPLTVAADGTSGYGQLEALTKYVRNGGGLAIFTGDRVKPAFYNGPFYDRGKGLCPIQIGPPAGDIENRKKFVRLQLRSISSEPVMRAFHGEGGQFTRLVRFYGYTPQKQGLSGGSEDMGNVRVLAKFDNTDATPAIIARSYGRGEIMMICTSANKEWTDWPRDLSYLPFVNYMIEHLSRRAGREFTATVGRPINYAIPTEMGEAKVTLKTPAFPIQAEIALKGQRLETSRVVTYKNPRYMGTYQLKLDLAGKEKTVLFARNVDPIEGNLVRISEKELRRQIKMEFTYHNCLASSDTESATVAGGHEYWKAALTVMLLMLAAEVFLGQRFGHYKSRD